MRKISLLIVSLSILLIINGIHAQEMKTDGTRKYDLSREPVLYTVGYAHLDTEWRWDYQETINDFIKATLDDNFRMLDKYKGYVFTFSGARRYKLMKDYYPERYDRLKKYISQNRWFVGGSSVDECDVNVPSPESVIRQVLYGNAYFRSEFGKESVDFLLPDCFGFQTHLPSVLAHCGIKGFSTQKLSWGSANGIPFTLGNWIGPDGKGLIAALDATDYTGSINPGLDTAKYWVDRVLSNGKKYGVFADFRYFGTGDVGGAPAESSIKNGVASAAKTDGPIHVYLSSSDQVFRDLTQEEKDRLPSFTGDLLLTQHSAGSLTSEAYMKRWNRKNEQLAQATEPLAVASGWLGGLPYLLTRLNQAWWLVLGSQMHDILPGTSLPRAYEFAWNDEVLAMNLFAGQLESSAGGVIRSMDTRTTGKAVVVYNPLPIPREDVVEAEISYPEGTPEYVNILDSDGKARPFQVLNKTKNSLKILFLANVPSMGLSCFDIQTAEAEVIQKNTLTTGSNFLENDYYKLLLNAGGDVSSIIDKKMTRELLSSPARLEFLGEHPNYWPAWNMDWNDRKNPPVGYVDGPAKITLVEKGPVRISFKIERSARNSTFIQYVRLMAGDAGKRIEFSNRIEWQSKGVSLKASFPLTVSNDVATYNLGFGTTERATNEEKKYEVPSREWFDLTDKSGNAGVTVIEDSKFGSDKPNDKTLRLTLLYTPAANFYHDQATQDWGTHEITYGLYSHKSDWRAGKSEWQARSLNQPLKAFQVSSHAGFLGKSFSLLKVNTDQVDVRALKKAENGKDIIIRLQELFGKDAQKVEVSMAGKITSAYEVDGQERKISDATITNGKLVVDFTKYAMHSFAVQIESPAEKKVELSSVPILLTYDQDVVSSDKDKANGKFTDGGYSYPAELFPDRMTVDGILFNLGSKIDGQNNVIACQGQKILLPKVVNYNKLYILAAATRDTTVTFRSGEIKKTFRVEGYTGKIGQSDLRTWDKYGRIKGFEPGFIKRDEVAFFTTHVHQDTANVPYQYGYVYKYSMDISPSGEFLQLPNNPAVKIFAISVADNPYDNIQPVQPLYDDLSDRKAFPLALEKRIVTESMTPVATIKDESRRNLNDLPYRVTRKDYADMHSPNGVTVNYYFSGTEKLKQNQPQQGMSIFAANDGMFELLEEDSLKEAWFEKGEGRIVMDFQKSTEIDSIHMFSVLNTKRGAPAFSLWISNKETPPVFTGDPNPAEWQFVLYAAPVDMWGNSKCVYTVAPLEGKNLSGRYLMWVSEDSPHGPYYFREIDVFEK
jgi:alpha-mannosidase